MTPIMGDFNPDFKFDFGDGGAAAQPAWEFSGTTVLLNRRVKKMYGSHYTSASPNAALFFQVNMLVVSPSLYCSRHLES